MTVLLIEFTTPAPAPATAVWLVLLPPLPPPAKPTAAATMSASAVARTDKSAAVRVVLETPAVIVSLITLTINDAPTAATAPLEAPAEPPPTALPANTTTTDVSLAVSRAARAAVTWLLPIAASIVLSMTLIEPDPAPASVNPPAAPAVPPPDSPNVRTVTPAFHAAVAARSPPAWTVLSLIFARTVSVMVLTAWAAPMTIARAWVPAAPPPWPAPAMATTCDSSVACKVTLLPAVTVLPFRTRASTVLATVLIVIAPPTATLVFARETPEEALPPPVMVSAWTVAEFWASSVTAPEALTWALSINARTPSPLPSPTALKASETPIEVAAARREALQANVAAPA